MVAPLKTEDVYYSSASLDNINYAHVFYDKEGSYCKGILFEYRNRTQQSIGQCGIHVFREKKVVSPLTLFHQPVKLQYGTGVMVDFATAMSEGLDRVGWASEKLSGIITFWFNCDSAILVVKSGSGEDI